MMHPILYCHAILILIVLSPKTHADEWFVELDGAAGYYTSPGVPERAIVALKQAQTENIELKSFSFTPAGDWVALSRSRFWSSDEGLPVCQKLKEMQQHKEDNKCVAFAPTGLWTILSGWNGFWIPGGGPAWNKIGEIARNGGEIRSVSYGLGDSWVVLYDKTGIGYGGIPADLTKVLNHAVSNNIAIQCVAFTGRDWICLAHDDWWTSNTNLPAVKIIDQNFRAGLHPRWIAFVPNPGPFNARKFGSIIRQSMAGKLAGGYACEVIDHGKVVVALAEGWARAPWEKNDPSIKWTINKPIEIASVSKTITAAGLLKLWEESASTSRRFSLDESFWPYIRDICPDVNDGVKKITIRQVLRHRSGFAENVGNNPNELRRLLSLPLAHPPGTFYDYQNINYYIIRLLIEQIGKVDYTAYVKTRVLAPMGILHMETHNEEQQPMCCYAKPGIQESGEEGHVDSSSWVGPGGWYASATDLGIFLEGLRQCRVLSYATTAMMFKENLGWDMGNPWTKGGLHLGPHDGRIHTEIWYFPDGVEAVILINCEPADSTTSLAQAWKDARY